MSKENSIGTTSIPAVKEEKDSKLGFKTFFGSTSMSATYGIASALMTSWFMVYLTDYSGIGERAAGLGAALLLGAGIFDAVNDPIQGLIMDRAKVGKYGKYKPFIIASIILMTIGVTSLFFIPSSISGNPVLVSVWVILFYLMWDIGQSFFAPNLIYRSVTLDEVERGKLMIGPRLLSMILGMVTAGLISIVVNVNKGFNDMHTAFGVTITVIMVTLAVVSLIGILLIKEKHHKISAENAERVKFKDIFTLLKENKALQVKAISEIFAGFIWTFLFATALYYIKWAYSANLETGQVNGELYSLYSLIASMMMFVPLILGTIIATPLMKKFGSAIKLHKFLILVEAISCGALFVFQITGLLDNAPFLFFICLAITATAIGINFIPDETLKIECMDFDIYSNGKDRSALSNAVNKLITKIQGASSTGFIGVLLVAVGYVVDSETDTYTGDLSSMPSMLNWFIVVMGLIPCILGFIAWFVLKSYPVTDEVRSKMGKSLD